MANKRKIRLILISNHLTSLFMSAWFRQNKYHENTEIQTFLVFTHPKVDDTYSEKSEEKTRINYEGCRASWDEFNFPWITFQIDSILHPRLISKNPFHLFHFIRNYKERKILFELITSWFSNHLIHPQEVYEIWYGNDFFISYLFEICTHAQGVSFEHGLSDVHVQLSSCKPIIQPSQKPLLQQWPSNYKNKTSGFFQLLSLFISVLSHFSFLSFFVLFIRAEFGIQDRSRESLHISLFADELRSAGCEVPQGKIDPTKLKQLITQIMKNDESTPILQSLEGNTAVVLISHIAAFARSPKDHLGYYRELEKYIVNQWTELFDGYNIKHIVFKTQLFHEHSFNEALDNYGDLKTKYTIHDIASYSKKNYNIEFYLPALKPALLIGAYSSGLLFAKKIDPHLITITYHEWVINYTMKEYHTTYLEFLTWFPKDFEVTFRDIFEPVLPEKALYYPIRTNDTSD